MPPEFCGPEAGEPLRALAQDRRHRGEALRVVDRGGLAVQAEVRRERRLEARLALLALERLEQRGFLAADVGAGADERVEVEVDAGAQHVPAEQARRVGLLERRLEARHGLGHELAADVVVADRGAHRVAADGHALDQRVRVVAQDVAVVAGAGLALVGVADDVLLHRRVARHERPLEARREAGAAAAAQARGLDHLDDLLARRLLGEDLLPGLVAADLHGRSRAPTAARACSGSKQTRFMRSVQSLTAAPYLCSSRILSTFSGVRFS